MSIHLISHNYPKYLLQILPKEQIYFHYKRNYAKVYVIAYVKLHLRDHFLQEWNSNLENSSKALNYRLYKRIFEFENSFNILENKYIFTFCKFRTTYNKYNNNNSNYPGGSKLELMFLINWQSFLNLCFTTYYFLKFQNINSS
jgi:hypothetical protein